MLNQNLDCNYTFRLIRHETEIRLEPIQSEDCHCNTNLVWINKIHKRFLCLYLLNKVLRLPKTLIIQGNIFVLNHQSKEVNNSLTIVNLFAGMIQYEDITWDD